MATTLADLRTAVASELGVDNSTSGDQTEIDRWANAGVRRILLDTRAYVTSQTPTIGANADFSLDSLTTDILEIVNLSFASGGSQFYPERVSVDEILRLRSASAATTGPATFYALAGHDTLMFYPTPGASDVATLYYVPLPTEMSSGTHDAFSMSGTNYGKLPIFAWDALFYFVCWKLASLDDDSSSEQGERYRALYEEALGEVRRFMRRKGGTKLPRARFNARRRRLLTHNNSTDV